MATKRSKTVETTLAERGKTHGPYERHALIAQALKDAMRLTAADWNALPSDVKESLEMIQHKVARVLNGGWAHPDTWHDIGGYALLIKRRLDGTTKPR